MNMRLVGVLPLSGWLWCGATVIALMLTGCGDKRKPEAPAVIRPVKMFVAGDAGNTTYHYYPAKVRSGQRVKLAFQVPGQLLKFPVKAGQMVKQGELLGELDSRDYANTLKSATARYNESKTEFERYAKLVGKQAVSVALFEEKRKTYEVAEAEMRIAEKALADTRLLAPFDGVVASTYVDNFQNIQAKQEILSLQGNTAIELVINVPEKDVIKSPAAMPLDQANRRLRPIAIFPALKNLAFPLEIIEFETEADTATQTYRCVLVMPAPKEFSILAGMTALVRVQNIDPRNESAGIPVPVTAVGQDAKGVNYVWVINAQLIATKRPVTAGAIDDDRIMIKSGLEKGEVIAAAGINFVAEGMKVKQLDHIGARSLRNLPGVDK